MQHLDAVRSVEGELPEQDLGPLAWVLDELRRTLDAAVRPLKRFAQEAARVDRADIAGLDTGPLRLARQQLHSSTGAVEMVGMREVAKGYLRPKPAYYYVKRACAPVLLSFDHQGGEAEAWIVNDRLEPVQGLLSVGRVAGGVLAGPMERLPVTVADNSIQRVWSGPAADDPAEEWLIGMLDMGGRVVGRASHFFSLPRQVGFPAPAVHLQQEYLDGILIIAVAGDTYTRAISLEGLPDQARPDDNYFDLFPGEVRRIGVAGLSPEEAAQVRVITGQSVTPARRGQPAPALAGAR